MTNENLRKKVNSFLQDKKLDFISNNIGLISKFEIMKYTIPLEIKVFLKKSTGYFNSKKHLNGQISGFTQMLEERSQETPHIYLAEKIEHYRYYRKKLMSKCISTENYDKRVSDATKDFNSLPVSPEQFYCF